MKMRVTGLVVLAVLVLAVPLAANGYLASYTGGLTSSSTSGNPNIIASGLDGTGFWIDPGPSTLTWLVTRLDQGQPWHYSYTFTTPGPGGSPSHLIVEASNPLGSGWPDFFNEVGDFQETSISTHTGSPGVEAGGNPYMPADLYGIKFDTLSGDLVVSFDFDSWRTPVWGDFYSKCGKTGGTQNTAWNIGFAAADPTAAPSNGSVDYHVLRPDTLAEEIPEPGTVALMGLGLLALVSYRRRRRKDQE